MIGFTAVKSRKLSRFEMHYGSKQRLVFLKTLNTVLTIISDWIQRVHQISVYVTRDRNRTGHIVTEKKEEKLLNKSEPRKNLKRKINLVETKSFHNILLEIVTSENHPVEITNQNNAGCLQKQITRY